MYKKARSKEHRQLFGHQDFKSLHYSALKKLKITKNGWDKAIVSSINSANIFRTYVRLSAQHAWRVFFLWTCPVNLLCHFNTNFISWDQKSVTITLMDAEPTLNSQMSSSKHTQGIVIHQWTPAWKIHT